MKKRHAAIITAALLAGVSVTAAPARATAIEIAFAGNWDSKSGGFSGRINYDTNAMNDDDSRTDHGHYKPVSFSMTSTDWEWSASSDKAKVTIDNDYAAGNGTVLDEFAAASNASWGLVSSGIDLDYVWLQLFADTELHNPFTDDSLPTATLSLDDFIVEHRLWVRDKHGSDYYGTITSLTLSDPPTPVPEPATGLMLLAGILTFSPRRHKQAKSYY